MQPDLQLDPDRDLRAELTTAIEAARAAAAAAEKAASIAGVADRLMREAAAEVEHLRIAQKEGERRTAEQA